MARPILGSDERALEAERLSQVLPLRTPLRGSGPRDSRVRCDGSVPELSWSWLLFELAQVVGEAMLVGGQPQAQVAQNDQFFKC